MVMIFIVIKKKWLLFNLDNNGTYVNINLEANSSQMHSNKYIDKKK